MYYVFKYKQKPLDLVNQQDLKITEIRKYSKSVV